METNPTQVIDADQPPGIARRLAAIFYDCLLLFAVLFAATGLLLPFVGSAIAPDNPLYTTYLLTVAFAYFGWFWTHGGQTLGMRTWKLRVCHAEGGTLNWSLALARYLAAALSWLLLGAGFIWALVDREHLTLHDRLSKTILVRSL